MGIENFNPQLWTPKLLANWNKAHVYVARHNRHYEGEVKGYGSSVVINSHDRPTAKTLADRNAGLGGKAAIDGPELIDGAAQHLLIDQLAYENFGVGDIDKKQQNPKVITSVMRDAAWALKDKADTFAAGRLSAGVATANILNGGTAYDVGTGPGDADAFELLVDGGVVLDENDVPEEGRWAIVPPWYVGMLVKDPRFSSFGTTENRKVAANGFVGEFKTNGLRVYRSNNVPLVNSDEHEIIIGHEDAATWAEQINDVEPYRPEGGFADAVKVLHVYGQKVTRPYALAMFRATPV